MSFEQKLKKAQEEVKNENFRKVKYHLKKKTKKVGFKKRIWNWVHECRFVLAIIMLTIGIVGTICFYEGKKLWADYSEAMGIWENHAKWKIENAEAKTTEPKIEQEENPVDEIADIIYKLESSSGKNDQKCERLGENSHNGYGYAQGENRNFCLESDDEVRKLVIKWLKDKREKGFDDKTTLCIYNTGIETSDCDYVKNI